MPPKGLGPRAVRSIQKAADVQLHHWVTLNDQVNLAEFHQDPQALFGNKINRGDLVTLVSGDGQTIYFACFVKSNVGGIYLDAPLRMTGLEESPLYGNARYQVRSVGKQYGVFPQAGSEPIGQLWGSARAAENDLHRRMGGSA